MEGASADQGRIQSSVPPGNAPAPAPPLAVSMAISQPLWAAASLGLRAEQRMAAPASPDALSRARSAAGQKKK